MGSLILKLYLKNGYKIWSDDLHLGSKSKTKIYRWMDIEVPTCWLILEDSYQ